MADLLNFRHMPVAANAVAVDALSNLCVQKILLGAPASSANARFGVNDDVLLLYEASLHDSR